MEQPRVRALVFLALIGGALLAAWAAGLDGPGGAAFEGGGLDAVRRVVPAGDRVLVEVLNGSGRSGAARQATRVLRRAGFDVIFYGTSAEQVDTTTVLIRRGTPRMGEWARDALGTGVVRSAADSARRLELTVVLGPDWRLPPGVIP